MRVLCFAFACCTLATLWLLFRGSAAGARHGGTMNNEAARDSQSFAFFLFFCRGELAEELQKQLMEQVELRKKLEREFQHLKGRKWFHFAILIIF